MRPMPSRLALAVLVGLVVLAPASVRAADHVFLAPDAVVAEPDGHFSITLQIILGTGGGSLGHGYLEGLQNCTTQLIGDGFCILEREEGETIEVWLGGVLEDPTAAGRVYVEASICSELDQNFWSTEVDVEPFTVPTEKESFGLVKARYSH